MAEFIPAILEQDFMAIKGRLTSLEGKVNWVQIDIADGDFVPNVTWSDSSQLESLSGKLKIEIHLMTQVPELQIKDWLTVADRIIFHQEVVEKPNTVLSLFENLPLSKEVALLLTTPLQVVADYIDQVDGVQLMGIKEVGQQGQAFAEAVIERVHTLHQEYPNLNISVDGGVNLKNAEALIAAGASRLVVGSAFWQLVEQTSLEQAIHSWRDVIER